jgi:arylsulfatase A-like enzyme
MLDTVRADHIGWYGHREMHTPNIDRLGQDGTMFENMFSQASWTRASVATILTGLYPSSHGAIHKADVLPDRVDTLAEALARGGYYTAGFANNINVAPEFGFGQGFAEYHYLAPDLFFWADEAAAELTLYSGLRLVRERFFAHRVVVTNYYRPAEEVVDRAVEWLDGAGKTERPFFLFLHFMDAHDPYMVHPFNGVGYARVAMPNPPPAMADTLRETYDGCITYIDANLGRLFAELKQRRLYDSTMIVLTADHGEEFNEHGGWWHGTTLYDEQVRVPLIIKGAATGVGGRLVTEMTTSLDIAPTILAAARIPAPPAMQGHALPLGNEPAPARDSVFAEEDFEGNVLASERTTSWKLITANPGNPRGLAPEELYDMAGDPKETKNLADAEPTKREEMRAALGRGTLEARAQGGAGQQTNVDSVTKSRLKALGYAD